MFASLTAPLGFALALLAAAGYAIATVGMKTASAQLSLGAVLAMGAGFAAAALAEMALMRHASLSLLYVTIIAAETVLVLLYACTIGEGLSTTQWLGAGCVLAGMALICQ